MNHFLLFSKTFNRILLPVSLLLHITSLIEYIIYSHDIVLPDYWLIIIVLLLLLSFTLSIILAITNSEGIIFIVFLLKISLITIIGYPMASNIQVEMILTISLVIEIILYIPLTYSVFFALGSVMFFILIQKPATIWGIKKPAPILSDVILLFIYPVIFIFLTSFLKYYAKLNDQKNATIDRLNKAITQITDANMGFQNYAFSVEKDSTDKERKRITREIHDIVGYTLTNQSMMLEASIILIDKNIGQLKKLIYHARDQVKEGMEDVRTTLHKLRSVEEPKPIGTKSILQLARTFEEITGVKTEVDLTNIPYSPGLKIERILIRIIQEGMTNALKHGSATNIKIVLWKSKESINISIYDNGNGSKDVKEGIGFKGIEERLKPFDGSFEAANTIDGFKLLVTIPLPEESIYEK